MCKTGHFHSDGKGFTLIELMVVMLLITIMLGVTIPRLDSSLLQDPRKKTTRWLINTVNALRAATMEKQKSHALVVNVNENRLWIMDAEMDEEALTEAEKKAFTLPGGMRIMEVRFAGKESVGSGNALITFYPGGYSDQAAINIESADAERFAYKVEPLLPRIKVVDEWISY
jgi:prepilin-type N-terminal cleavage/methylation domain-containing protein